MRSPPCVFFVVRGRFGDDIGHTLGVFIGVAIDRRPVVSRCVRGVWGRDRRLGIPENAHDGVLGRLNPQQHIIWFIVRFGGKFCH